MTDDGPAPEDDVAKDLLREIEINRTHPALGRWFHRIAEFTTPMAGLGVGSFVMAEFRDGRLGALVWSDAPGTWGTGGWKLLSRDSQFREDILHMPPVTHGRTFAEILEDLTNLRREAPAQPPWWRFWE